MDDQLDRRLMRTFFLALAAKVRPSHNRSGFILSDEISPLCQQRLRVSPDWAARSKSDHPVKPEP